MDRVNKPDLSIERFTLGVRKKVQSQSGVEYMRLFMFIATFIYWM